MDQRLTNVAKRFKDILIIAKSKILIIFCYSLAISIFTLIVPISVQALVNIVSFGLHMQPIIVLAMIILFMLSAAALLRLMLLMVTEYVQQKLFALIALNLAKRLPLITITALAKQRGTQLVNYFFEVITVQKALTRLLLYGVELMTQLLLSMVLLAFYHPFLLVFDILLAILICITILVPFKSGVYSAIEESTEKHRVAAWLDELLINPLLFRFQNYKNYVLQRTDSHVLNYLKSRRYHFKVLITHSIGTNLIYVLSFVSLLSLGGYLVIHEQLTLGQLVASEILLSIIISNVIKLSGQLESIYDLLAATDKIGFLFDIPVEDDQKQLSAPTRITHLNITNLAYQTSSQDLNVQGLNLALNVGEKLVIYDRQGCGKSMLLDIIAGLAKPTSGNLKFNKIPYQDFPVDNLRKEIFLLRGIELFSGTLYENITLNNSHVQLSEVHKWCEYFALDTHLANLPKGLATEINLHQTLLSTLSLKKLMLIRLLLADPAVILIDGFLDHFSHDELKHFFAAIDHKPQLTLIVTQNKSVRDFLPMSISL